jgi:branched-chain amino acid transport system ATP-binding protein
VTSQSETVLSLQNVHAAYDGIIVALRGVSLDVKQGSIVALLGGNGAGKTTTLKAASGLLAAERGAVTLGSVWYRGQNSEHREPRELVKAGLSQVLEGRHCFPHFSVEENLIAGALVRRPSRAQLVRHLERVYEQFPRLKALRRSLAGFTSGGEQQMLAIGRALMAEPTLLLLDEPSMGLAPQIVEEIFEIVKALQQNGGVSFLLAEQNATLALRYADHGYVLENGQVKLSGSGAELAARDEVKELYLGVQQRGPGEDSFSRRRARRRLAQAESVNS